MNSKIRFLSGLVIFLMVAGFITFNQFESFTFHKRNIVYAQPTVEIYKSMLNYVNYEWVDINHPNGDGSRLYLNFVNDRFILTMVNRQSPPASRIARFSAADLQMIGINSAEFYYENDGWGNKGKGIVYFGQNQIKVSITETYQDPRAMWSMFKGEKVFVKSPGQEEYKY